MKYYAALDVSLKSTSICIVNAKGKIIKEAAVESSPSAIHDFLKQSDLAFEAVGLETGSLSHWLMNNLLALKLPAVLLDARKIAPILKASKINKTDRNDARGIANILRTENYTPVHHKSQAAIELGTALQARQTLVNSRTSLCNSVRGLLKTYGVKLGKKKSLKTFIQDVILAIKGQSVTVQHSILGLLSSLKVIDEELTSLNLKIEEIAEADEDVQRFQSAPGVGPITALAFKAEMDNAERFISSRNVPAYFGLTPSQYASGETCIQGSISKQGSKMMRYLLVGAGISILCHSKKWSKLKAWGMRLKKKKGTKRAAVAIARKLAIILHRMWLKKEAFRFESKEKAKGKNLEKAA